MSDLFESSIDIDPYTGRPTEKVRFDELEAITQNSLFDMRTGLQALREMKREKCYRYLTDKHGEMLPAYSSFKSYLRMQWRTLADLLQELSEEEESE